MRSSDLDRDPILERFFDRATAQISVPRRHATPVRRLRLVPVVGGVALAGVALVGALVVGVAVNNARSGAVGAPPPSGVAVTAREPSNLPVLPEEAAVVSALDAAGIHLTLIGGSKFDTLLGERQPARVFIAQAGAGGAGADVLFLERPITDIRVCLSKAASGLNHSDIFIGTRLVSSGEGTQQIYYSVSDRYFIQAVGKEFSDALMAGLGTVTPPC